MARRKVGTAVTTVKKHLSAGLSTSKLLTKVTFYYVTMSHTHTAPTPVQGHKYTYGTDMLTC